MISINEPALWIFFGLLLTVFANGLSDHTLFGRKRRKRGKQRNK